MKSKKQYTKNDKVLIKTFAGPDVCVILKKRFLVHKTKHKLGVDGWDAQFTNQKEVEKLRMLGVPYKKDSKPIVFVADWQIIKKC
jgi:hypothetical protein